MRKSVKHEEKKEVVESYAEGFADVRVFQHYIPNQWIHYEDREFEFTSEYYEICSTTSKEDLLKAIKEMVTKAKQVGVDTILFYFTGPSIFPSANWCILERLDKSI